MRVIIYISLLFLANIAFAQDLHFTQFFAAPLQVNPAQAGFFNADYRVGGNFKQQWPWARDNRLSNYRTLSLYGDIAMMKHRGLGRDWMGGGIAFFNDNAGDGNLSINKIGLSLAYHKVLDRNQRFVLSFGAGANFINKKIDYTALYFDAQWSDDAFDTGLPNQEANSSESIMYADLTAGLMFSAKIHKDLRTHIGLGMMHLNKPKESFYGTDNRLGIRPTVHAGVNWRINDLIHIEPGVFYSFQKRAQEGVLSLLAGYHPQKRGFLNESVIYLGAAYRTKDALVPMLGFEYKRWKTILNYDVNLSRLKEASNGVGGIEISVVYLGIRPINQRKIRIPCPRL